MERAAKGNQIHKTDYFKRMNQLIWIFFLLEGEKINALRCFLIQCYK